MLRAEYVNPKINHKIILFLLVKIDPVVDIGHKIRINDKSENFVLI
tara:strand:+ start:543 stop:680 length:138 start_codon:yes stop_codon:yes gene_type:complete